jgi:hypothetical protein
VWLTLALVVLAPLALASPESDPFITELVVPGSYCSPQVTVGEVQVWNDETNVYVTYVITDPNYFLSVLSLSVKGTLAEIPRECRGGGFDTRKFEYKQVLGEDVTEHTFTVPLGEWTTDDLLYLAAHAAVKKEVVWKGGKWCNRYDYHYGGHCHGHRNHGHSHGHNYGHNCGGKSYSKCDNKCNHKCDNKCGKKCDHRCDNKCGGGTEKRYFQTMEAWGFGERITKCQPDMWFNYIVEGYKEVNWPSEENPRITIGFEDKPLTPVNPPMDWDYNDWAGDIEITAKVFGNEDEGYNWMSEVTFDFFRMVRMAGATHRWRLGADVFPCNGTYEVKLNGVVVETGVYDSTVGVDVMLLDTGDATEVNATVTITFDDLCPYVLPEFDQNTFHGESLFFDPYLVRNAGRDPAEEIHAGDIRMLVVPTDWSWPNEGQAVWLKYPKVQPAVWLGSSWQGPVFVPYWWE